MRKKFLLIVLGLCIASIACKKTHNINIQAIDLNGGSKNAYAGIDFAIIQSRPGIGTDEFKRVYEGIFDDNGQASFDLKMNKNWSYILTMSEPENICYNNAFGIRLSNDKSNNVTFDYAKCGKLKFILNNQNCNGSEDKVKYSRRWLTTDKFDGENTYFGCEYFEGDFFNLAAGSYNYTWTVTKNNTSTSFSEDFTITAGENTTFAINY